MYPIQQVDLQELSQKEIRAETKLSIALGYTPPHCARELYSHREKDD
jgi:hypothetical protein